MNINYCVFEFYIIMNTFNYAGATAWKCVPENRHRCLGEFAVSCDPVLPPDLTIDTCEDERPCSGGISLTQVSQKNTGFFFKKVLNVL